MKIALLEDRIERMEQFSEIDLMQEPLIDIITNSHLKALLSEIDQNKTDTLDNYNCILLHRSALTNYQRDIIKNYCTNQQKPLVYFSGGISSSIYNDNVFPFLHINSKDVYSSNLQLFLTETGKQKTINLLILQFGMRWKLNLLLSLRNYINLGTHLESIKRIRDLRINLLIKDEIIQKFNLAWLNQNEVTLITEEQIDDFKQKVDELIIYSYE